MTGEEETWSAATDPPSPASPPAGPIRSGDRVGRYVVIDRLGVGGMGVVYTAYDPQLDRKIALKLLHPAVGDATAGQRRLLREAQAMAKLRHPNVAAVHDVGTHGGRVFIAMELVEGRTLRAWLDETGGRRPWREVVRVASQAAAGLAAAHDEGLVHRDFKPDNVMLDAGGHARVMDFGVARARATPSNALELARAGRVLEPSSVSAAERARARVRAALAARGKLDAGSEPSDPAIESTADAGLAPDPSAQGVTLTRPGALVGTPAYMAPEQLDAADVDARADQFAFCVVLFEALYGQRPFTGETLADLATNIIEGRMAPVASRAAVPRWLHRLALRGLAGDPGARHRDMHTIAAALVEIPRRRRRIGIAGLGTLVAAGIVVGGVVIDRSVCGGAAQALSPTWNAARHDAVKEALAAVDVPFADDTARRTTDELDAYAEGWIVMHEEACRATNVARDQSERMLDRRMSCLQARRRAMDGLVGVLSEPDATVAEHAVEAALHLPPIAACGNLQALAASELDPPAPETSEAIERARESLARAEALGDAGRHASGLEALDAIEEPAVRYPPLAAEVALARGKLLDLAGKRTEAEDALREAARAARSAGHDEVGVAAEIELAFVAGYRLRLPDRGAVWAEIADAGLERLGDPPGSRARLENHLGVVLHAAGDPQAGLEHLRRAREIRRAELGEEHLDTAESDYNLAIALRATGAYEEAREHVERALAVRRKVLGEAHPRVAETLSVLGVITLRAGDPKGARELFEQALRIQTDAYGSDHPQIATTSTDLGAALASLGEIDAADRRFREALRISEATLGREHPDVLRGRHNLAAMWAAHGDPGEARALFESVLADRERTLGTEHPDVAKTASALGAVLVDLGQLAEARPILERALAGPEGLEPVVVARTEMVLARALAADTTTHAEARDHAERARALFSAAGEGYAEHTRAVEELLATLPDP